MFGSALFSAYDANNLVMEIVTKKGTCQYPPQGIQTPPYSGVHCIYMFGIALFSAYDANNLVMEIVRKKGTCQS